jgi:hypothetical protein
VAPPAPRGAPGTVECHGDFVQNDAGDHEHAELLGGVLDKHNVLWPDHRRECVQGEIGGYSAPDEEWERNHWECLMADLTTQTC